VPEAVSARKIVKGREPGFSCSQTANSLCGVALKDTKEIDPEAARTLVSKQEAWRRTRDDCGVEVRCLGQAMRKRLDELSTDPQ
jgi:hypothetical protein